MDTAIAFTASYSGVVYAFRDDFTTEEAAPLASPRTAEPGPGTLTITDTGNKWSINSSGELVMATGVSSWTDSGCVTQEITSPAAGRILIAKASADSTQALGILLWSTNAALNITGYGETFYFTSNNVFRLVTQTQIGSYTTNTYYEMVTTLRNTGVHHFVKGGSQYPEWTHLWIDATASLPSSLWGIFNHFYQSGKLDYLRIPDSSTTYTPTPVASDSFNRVDSTNLGSTDGAGAEESGGDGLTWTEQNGDFETVSNRLKSVGSDPGGVGWLASCDAGESDVLCQAVGNYETAGSTGLVVRLSNSTNFWVTTVNASNLTIWEVNGGAFTNRASGASSTSDNTDHNILLIADGTNITAYINGAGRITYGSATYNQTATGCGVRTHSVNAKHDNFVIWPRTVTDFPEV